MDIKCENLKHTYDKKTPFAYDALNGISLEIKEGDFFGIIGHTGSGKSTFIQFLNGLIRTSEGKLNVGEFDLTNKKCDLLALRKSVGMVFQYPEYQLFAETVEKDVVFGYRNFIEKKNRNLEEERVAVKEAIEAVGLDYEAIKDKSPFELSGGQKRRVAIAGVIVSKPKILVLDEPASGLDPLGKKEMFALLDKLKESFVETVIIISHDMNEVAEHCNRVAVFNDGVIEYILPPSELFQKEEELLKIGLDIPLTFKILNKLKENGIKVDYNKHKIRDIIPMLKGIKDGGNNA